MASFALYKTSHPRFMTSSHHFYDITPTIFDILSAVAVSSHPLYWWYHTNWIFEISSAMYEDIIFIVYDITAQNVCHHTHSFNGITTFVCRISQPLYIISYTLYKAPRPHHTTLFMRSHALCSWHHCHYIWNDIHCICVITSTPVMVSDQLFV